MIFCKIWADHETNLQTNRNKQRFSFRYFVFFFASSELLKSHNLEERQYFLLEPAQKPVPYAFELLLKLVSAQFKVCALWFYRILLLQILGPKLMENRKPFELKQVLIWYNLFQVLFSVWLFNEVRIMQICFEISSLLRCKYDD